MTKHLYRCGTMRPITADPADVRESVCAQFARRVARRRFGKAGRVLSICTALWTKDGSSTTYNVSIGKAAKPGEGPDRHCALIQLTLTREIVAKPDYDPGPSERLWQARMAGDMSA